MNEDKKTEQTPPSKEERFVEQIIQKCKENPAFRASMRKAGSINQEHECWPILLSFGIDINKSWERLPYVLVGSVIASEKVETNGKLAFMTALSGIYADQRKKGADKDDQSASPAGARLRRLLSCSTTQECCMVLRPMMHLVLSRTETPVNLAELLRNLLFFEKDTQRIKAVWATDFYKAEVKK